MWMAVWNQDCCPCGDNSVGRLGHGKEGTLGPHNWAPSSEPWRALDWHLRITMSTGYSLFPGYLHQLDSTSQFIACESLWLFSEFWRIPDGQIPSSFPLIFRECSLLPPWLRRPVSAVVSTKGSSLQRTHGCDVFTRDLRSHIPFCCSSLVLTLLLSLPFSYRITRPPSSISSLCESTVGTHSKLQSWYEGVLNWRHLRFNQCREKAFLELTLP